MLGVYTIVEAAEEGWALGADAHPRRGRARAARRRSSRRQARVAHPLVPLRIFRSRTVSAANVVQALMVAGMFGVFFLGALYLQRVLGYDAIEVGLAFLPVALDDRDRCRSASRRGSSRASARAATLLPGLVLIAAGLVLFVARAGRRRRTCVDLLPAMLLLGIGAGPRRSRR